MRRKWLAFGIILFFIGTSFTPFSKSEQTHVKNIITVDDEPGDADFTSIKEAVNSSSPGDTIEVYSGNYSEDEILISKDNVSLLGISYELGEGNDSGKPFVKGNAKGAVIRIESSHVIVSNFTIENPRVENHSLFYLGIYVAKYAAPTYEDDVTISDCIIHDAHLGIYLTQIENIRITDNQISDCILGGIKTESFFVMGFTVTGNVITDCRDVGIHYSGYGDHINISGNRIKNCSVGIDFSANNTKISGNDIEDCPLGIKGSGSGSIITQNNFVNYSRVGFWFYKYIFWPGKIRWIGNYWDTWSGKGPKIILGFIYYEWSSLEGGFFLFLIPWLAIDWHPARKPYDISITG
jgi:parallel beta-helix repeat protein